MKKYLFILVAISAVAVTGCRKIESDGEKEIIIVPGGGGGGGGQTIILKDRINADTTLRKENTYILKGLVYIVGNHTLTIEAGTVIKGSFSGSDVAALIITRGSKINAVGTATEPIVFTSASPNPQSGDWGGIVICGKAGINTAFAGTGGGPGIYEVEGGINNGNGDGLAGGGATPDDNDNSGKLQFVRIEYAGYAFQPDKEINSLTLAAVGRGTTIDHIQVVLAKDDAYEWFGGTVNCKYLIAVKTQDDDFDTDNGYSGNVQFGLILRDSLIADVSTSEAFESDNNSSGTTVTPKTSAVFSNITAIGPRATLSNVGNSLFRAGAQIRRNSSISIFNSIIMGWPQGILIDASTGTPTDKNIDDSTLRIRYTTLAGNTVNLKYTASTSAPTGATDATILSWFTNPYFGNTVLTNASDARLTQPFSYAQFDPTPFGSGSNNQATGAVFTGEPKLANPFFDVVPFRGGVTPSLSSAGTSDANWWKGWTKFNYN